MFVNLFVFDVEVVICEILVVFNSGCYMMMFMCLYLLEGGGVLIDLLGF